MLPSDIPGIDLYLDQVSMLLERKLPGYAEKPMTKAMINNYSRENLIRDVAGKKYTRQHILQMLIVYHLKPVLGMQEIRKMYDFIDMAGITYESCYLIMLEEKNRARCPEASPEASKTKPPERDGSPESCGGQPFHGDVELLRSFLFCAFASMRYKEEAVALLGGMSRMETKSIEK